MIRCIDEAHSDILRKHDLDETSARVFEDSELQLNQVLQSQRSTREP